MLRTAAIPPNHVSRGGCACVCLSGIHRPSDGYVLLPIAYNTLPIGSRDAIPINVEACNIDGTSI